LARISALSSEFAKANKKRKASNLTNTNWNSSNQYVFPASCSMPTHRGISNTYTAQRHSSTSTIASNQEKGELRQWQPEKAFQDIVNQKMEGKYPKKQWRELISDKTKLEFNRLQTISSDDFRALLYLIPHTQIQKLIFSNCVFNRDSSECLSNVPFPARKKLSEIVLIDCQTAISPQNFIDKVKILHDRG